RMDEKDIQAEKLQVVRGRLQIGSTKSTGFRASDYLLYSLRVLDGRDDFSQLPFYRLYQDAIHEAASTAEGSWDRAKAALVTVYQQMLTSPDLTLTQVDLLTNTFRDELLKVRDQAKKFATLGKAVDSLPLNLEGRGASDVVARLERLGEIHKLLTL